MHEVGGLRGVGPGRKRARAAGALALALLLGAGCAKAPAVYPETATALFARTCPLSDARCACTFEEIRKTMDADAFTAAIARFEREGLMDPKLVQAREACREKG